MQTQLDDASVAADVEADLECDWSVRQWRGAVQLFVDLVFVLDCFAGQGRPNVHARSASGGSCAGTANMTPAREISVCRLLAHTDANRRPLVLANRAARGNR